MFHREESEEPCPSETSQGGQGSQPCGPNGADLCASEDDMMRIWGMDPVHPSKTAYTNMAVSSWARSSQSLFSTRGYYPAEPQYTAPVLLHRHQAAGG